jgi:hypothetical protein
MGSINLLSDQRTHLEVRQRTMATHQLVCPNRPPLHSCYSRLPSAVYVFRRLVHDQLARSGIAPLRPRLTRHYCHVARVLCAAARATPGRRRASTRPITHTRPDDAPSQDTLDLLHMSRESRNGARIAGLRAWHTQRMDLFVRTVSLPKKTPADCRPRGFRTQRSADTITCCSKPSKQQPPAYRRRPVSLSCFASAILDARPPTLAAQAARRCPPRHGGES